MSPPFINAFPFIPPEPSARRSPCPALNTLANHGYISRDGTNIPFWKLLNAVKFVYNLSFPLALLLTVVGYLTCGAFSLYSLPHLAGKVKDKHHRSPNFHILTTLIGLIPNPTWTLDLSSLCYHGPLKIAHDASLVHTEDQHTTRSSPDPALLAQLLGYCAISSLVSTGTRKLEHSNKCDGLTLKDLSLLHASREATLRPSQRLDWFHKRVALGECALSWCVMRSRRPYRYYGNLVGQQREAEDENDAVIPFDAVRRWFGEERLPDGWWDASDVNRNGSLRPVHKVGLREAGRKAKEVARAS